LEPLAKPSDQALAAFSALSFDFEGHLQLIIIF
jgi:hypothetical protein